MHNLRIIKSPYTSPYIPPWNHTYNLKNRINSPDMAQKRIPQARPGTRALCQPGDIIHGQKGRDLGRRLVQVAEPGEAVVWDGDTGFFGVDGCVGVVCWVAEVAAGEGLEEG